MSRKVLLATMLALALMPLAAAHSCQPGVWSVDPNHAPPVICNLLVCWGPPHACRGDVPPLLGDPAGLPLLP